MFYSPCIPSAWQGAGAHYLHGKRTGFDLPTNYVPPTPEEAQGKVRALMLARRIFPRCELGARPFLTRVKDRLLEPAQVGCSGHGTWPLCVCLLIKGQGILTPTSKETK